MVIYVAQLSQEKKTWMSQEQQKGAANYTIVFWTPLAIRHVFK
jgi:hypothetical protein